MEKLVEWVKHKRPSIDLKRRIGSSLVKDWWSDNMKVLITGGAGLLEVMWQNNYAKRNNEVIVFDNLSRAVLLGYSTSNAMYNQRF